MKSVGPRYEYERSRRLNLFQPVWFGLCEVVTDQALRTRIDALSESDSIVGTCDAGLACVCKAFRKRDSASLIDRHAHEARGKTPSVDEISKSHRLERIRGEGCSHEGGWPATPTHK